MDVRFQRLFLFGTFVLMLAISSCTSSTSSETPVPVVTSTPSVTPAPVVTSTMSIETRLADPGYMAGCKAINPELVDEQASYKGVNPGLTTQDEIRSIFGKPLRVPQIKETVWEYDYMSVFFDESTVSKLYAFGDNATTLNDLILQYGCPDGIYVVDVSEHGDGAYSRLLFFYHRIGFDFTIDHVPAKLSDTVDSMGYFVPGTLEDYNNTFHIFNPPDYAKLMTWDESVP
jgi:hypothetical protein